MAPDAGRAKTYISRERSATGLDADLGARPPDVHGEFIRAGVALMSPRTPRAPEELFRTQPERPDTSMPKIETSSSGPVPAHQRSTVFIRSSTLPSID